MFSWTFESRIVQANGIRQHVVVGGEGPPLLLIHGWPQNWYAWRLVMPGLARDFTVIAVDQRGIGLTELTATGYDTATLAADMAELMSTLGYGRFAVVGHDTGLAIAYALAADFPRRVHHLAVAEVPAPPGVVPPGPPLFTPETVNNRLWHIPFNRVDDELIVDMVHDHADAFFGYEFQVQGGGTDMPAHARDYYISLYNRDKDALRASFGFYRAWDQMLDQNAQRATTKLTIPVLGIGGSLSWGDKVAQGMMPAAEHVRAAVIPCTGHWVAEQGPEELVAVLRHFLPPDSD
ncbi:alpha/beta hydrolase [Kribbella sp. NPDC000426]|uniref:alpha/beta fold hydrolase n=1 Tax=Kribbella sp. NPDC000426 TaxID=3154255 RepID=UPI00331CA6F4